MHRPADIEGRERNLDRVDHVATDAVGTSRPLNSLRSLRPLGSDGTLLTLWALLTLGTLRSSRTRWSGLPLDSLRSHGADRPCGARVPLRSLGTRRTGRSHLAL